MYLFYLQLVCDHRAMITHCYAGYPGSVHDQRVFRLSEVSEFLNDQEKFPEGSHIIGDAAYELSEHLITPFKNNGHLSRRQENFNYKHSVARVTVERCIGLLKARMRTLLHCLPMTREHMMAEYIVACCVLHNICMLRRDDIDVITLVTTNRQDEIDQDNIPEPRGNVSGVCKRNMVMNMLQM